MYLTTRKEILKNAEINKSLNNDKLRYNEYYGLQPIFDDFYAKSKAGSKFNRLYDTITDPRNIMLAYRNIKRNHGSNTSGTNRHTIQYWEDKTTLEFIEYIRNRLENYQPQKVRRVEIPKPNGKTRPLGIPCIEDRIIQQCIKQVLEPICEAKFHPHSYGFRPNRNTEHAIAYACKKINTDKCYYVVDVDIKGFFDNVNHSKLLKQLWTIGIRDKKVLCILSKMLKAEVDKIGIPEKGVPQGGILSPLLSNVVLNELDWWISDQWFTFKTRYQYSIDGNKYRALKATKLKEMYIVRYADDFKIFCRTMDAAERTFIAVEQWLKDRLGLEISPEKSTITDIKKQSSDFLGFSIKGIKKRNKIIAYTSLTDKAKKSVEENIREQIKHIQHKQPIDKEVYLYNQLVAGIQNYYCIASNVAKDFRNINYRISLCLQGRLRRLASKTGNKSKEYNMRYAHYGGKTLYVDKIALYPVYAIKSKIPRVMNQELCNYTHKGRRIIHQRLGYLDNEIFKYLVKNPVPNETVEFNDNRLSLYSAQRGKCKITKEQLTVDAITMRLIPKEFGGTDKFNNLILVSPIAFDLLWNNDILNCLMKVGLLGISNKILKKINFYRRKIGNGIILS